MKKDQTVTRASPNSAIKKDTFSFCPIARKNSLFSISITYSDIAPGQFHKETPAGMGKQVSNLTRCRPLPSIVFAPNLPSSLNQQTRLLAAYSQYIAEFGKGGFVGGTFVSQYKLMPIRVLSPLII
jgi:hypothetical protein